MKTQIIPAGTPGIFRPEWGQFPEPMTLIEAWVQTVWANKPPTVEKIETRHIGVHMGLYAWQYAPPAPPVDGFAAFAQGWRQSKQHGYRYSSRGELHCYGNLLGTYPTLAAAQEAAYAHFLSTLNNPNP